MSDAPERIWMPLLWEVGDRTIPVDAQIEEDDLEYLHIDLHLAAIAEAEARGMRRAAEIAETHAREGKWADGFIMAADIAKAIFAAIPEVKP